MLIPGIMTLSLHHPRDLLTPYQKLKTRIVVSSWSRSGTIHVLWSLFLDSLIGRDAFTNDFICLLVSSQSQEDRLTKLVIARPLRELNLCHQYRLEPNGKAEQHVEVRCALAGEQRGYPRLTPWQLPERGDDKAFSTQGL